MSIRAKLRAAKPKASEREIDSLMEARQRMGAIQFETSAWGAQVGRKLWDAYPAVMRKFYQEGDSPARTAYRAFQMVADESKTKEVIQALGGRGDEGREALEAYVAQGLGLENARALRRDVLGPIVANEMATRVDLGMDERQIDRRVAGGKVDRAIPEISAAAREQAIDEAQRRNEIAALYDRAEASRSPVQRAKAALYDPGNDLQVDLHRAWAAHAGEHPSISPSSNGARQWAKRHGLEREIGEMVIAEKVAESDEIKGGVERQRESAAAIEAGRTRSQEGAWAANEGLDMDTVRRVENEYLPEGE